VCVRARSKLLPEYMAKWKLDRGALVELFGRRAHAPRLRVSPVLLRSSLT
jgi:hypothetical protein